LRAGRGRRHVRDVIDSSQRMSTQDSLRPDAPRGWRYLAAGRPVPQAQFSRHSAPMTAADRYGRPSPRHPRPCHAREAPRIQRFPHRDLEALSGLEGRAGSCSSRTVPTTQRSTFAEALGAVKAAGGPRCTSSASAGGGISLRGERLLRQLASRPAARRSSCPRDDRPPCTISSPTRRGRTVLASPTRHQRAA